MTTHKLIGSDYQYPYFCTSGGDIYYVDDVAERIYPEFGLVSREVDEHHYGKLTKYVSVPLLHKDGGRTPAADAGEMIARSVFNIDLGIPGFVRLKDRNLHNIHINNMEFVQTARYTGEVIAVWDQDGRTELRPLGKQVEPGELLPTKHTFADYEESDLTVTGDTRSIKLDLGERDRSMVAELLYSLIVEKKMPAADALKVLCIPGGYDTLELFLEGKDIVEERLTKEDTLNQERDKKEPSALDLVETNCQYNGATVYLNKHNGKAYIKSNGKPKELK